MKRFSVIFLILALSVPVFSQNIKVQAGYNTKYDKSYSGGISSKFKVAFLSVEPGIAYNNRQLLSDKNASNLGQVEIPVLAKLSLINVGPLGVYALGGVAPAFLLTGSVKTYKDFATSGRVGAGVVLFGRVEVEGYYGKSFTDVLASEKASLHPEDVVVSAGWRFEF